MRERKVIQLCAMPGYGERTDGTADTYQRTERVETPTLYALCDDGSIWAMDGNHDTWQSISTKSIREGLERNSAERIHDL